ncbi:sodium/potassium-transporting ATPase subunit beta-2-like [Contarinia nasturtii]|uniref:sodium/potassium-transporting ATPase subunit beta-2-like n=1 Tax=Contarinia nasturtii TaxID=265458 RepID=UPI0012D38326|nr:sodium/potassium-transporting ATPase subunit beta-2-like [Contarinia nasturtii]XP_031632334.1 sodium/potassium-transporting ATPase subunit beta-2-like [Contarinia nasturtii]XP_031632335.1 sodium/potassium-transporting ATPase subunit beta-2-like [Contarinia nasturtii]XP_031632336.1 sodium/potassium-transporting ATPase subunit beta-2-like [Contarinia nasturtii]
MMNNETVDYEDSARKLPKQFNFWRGIYNKDKNYIFGRTPKNWGELLLFYSIFYIILAALFAICMQSLLWTLDKKVPKWTLNESRIGDNPGLGFRPMPLNISQGSLVWLNSRNASTIKNYVDLIDSFLYPYEEATLHPHENSVNCDFENLPSADKVCRVNLSHFGQCTAANSYGYNSSQPCIFLKLNRIFNWTPEPFFGDTALPENMPNDLKLYIKSLQEKEQNQVFISCEGQNPSDKDSIGKISISPRGFPHYFFPYKNKEGYLSPLISVQFESPQRNKNINVECIAWAKNIVYRGGLRDRQGSIHFELMID